MTAHSYSNLNTYDTCPRKYEWQYVFKHKEPKSDQQLWGIRVHEALERRVQYKAPLIGEYEQYEWCAKPILAMEAMGAAVLTECKFAVTKEGTTTEFFGKDVFLRGVTDVFIVGERTGQNIDYKTGRPKHDFNQLELCNLLAFAKFPQLEQIESRYLWLQAQKSTHRVMNRSDMPKVLDKWIPIIERVEGSITSGVFKEKPNGLCREYCACLECPHNGRGK